MFDACVDLEQDCRGGMVLCSALKNWNLSELLSMEMGTVECGRVGRNIISICDSIGVSSYAVVWGLLEDTQFTENKLGSDPIFMVNLFE